MVSTRAVTAGPLSDLPPALSYGWSIAAAAPDPMNSSGPSPPVVVGLGGRVGPTCPVSGPLGLHAPRWGCLGCECFCFLPPRCSAIRPCPTGD